MHQDQFIAPLFLRSSKFIASLFSNNLNTSNDKKEWKKFLADIPFLRTATPRGEKLEKNNNNQKNN